MLDRYGRIDWCTPLAWRLVLGILSLLAAIAVYLFTRPAPPELLAPLQLSSPAPGSYALLTGSAPSLFYTLALCLLIGAVAAGRRRALVHCLAWTVLALILEISQLQLFATPLIDSLDAFLPSPAMNLVGPYWRLGVFDPLDLVATLLGACIALSLISCLPEPGHVEAG